MSNFPSHSCFIAFRGLCFPSTYFNSILIFLYINITELFSAHILVTNKNNFRQTDTKAMTTNKKELKHLGFVRVAAIQTFVVVLNLYEYAKQNSGPLRSTVGTVEGTVRSVIGPVCNKLKGLPDDVLVFVDDKVDEVFHKFKDHAPSFTKQVVSETKDLIQKAAQEAGKIASEARCGGPKVAINYVTAESKQFLLINVVKLWKGLNHIPPFLAVAEMAVPTAAHWSEKYNHVIKHMAGKGYSVFGYFPLIPIDEIAKAFKQGEGNLKADESGSD